VHIAVSFGVAELVVDDLAGKNVSEDGEQVEETLVVDGGGEVLHEDVAESGSAEGGVALGPHDSARSALDISEVHGIESSLSVLNMVEVDIGISERSASDGVAANTDGCDGSDSIEDLKEHSLGDIGIDVPDVKGGGLERHLRSSEHFLF